MVLLGEWRRRGLFLEARERASFFFLGVEERVFFGWRGQEEAFSWWEEGEYEDFRFSIRIHKSHVSSVSHAMMNRFEIERNPMFLAAVRALGDAHVKCCMQMYYALALLTKGSVRTLIRSVEGTNGAEAWRLLHGTQH